MHNKLILLTLLFILPLFGCNSDKSTEQETNIPEQSAQQDQNVSNNMNENQPQAVVQMLQHCLNGEGNQVKSMLDGGLPADVSDPQGQTCLMMAAYNGHADIVEMLIDRGAEINKQNIQGRTALMFASTGSFGKTVKMLLDAGAEPNITDKEEHWSALMFAAAEGQQQVAEILLNNGADATLKDTDGETASDFARNNNYAELAEMLK